jgi:hypothetical protein
MELKPSGCTAIVESEWLYCALFFCDGVLDK